MGTANADAAGSAAIDAKNTSNGKRKSGDFVLIVGSSDVGRMLDSCCDSESRRRYNTEVISDYIRLGHQSGRSNSTSSYVYLYQFLK